MKSERTTAAPTQQGKPKRQPDADDRLTKSGRLKIVDVEEAMKKSEKPRHQGMVRPKH